MTNRAATTYFQEKGQGFIDGIYGNSLGKMRQEQLFEDLEEFLKQQSIRTIVDIGAGHAPVTLKLLAHHEALSAVLVEPSAQLEAQSEQLQHEWNIAAHRIKRVRGDLAMIMENTSSYKADLMLSHAVANWTEDPKKFIQDFTELAVHHHAYASLVVGASRGKAFRFAHQGNTADLLQSVANPGSLVRSFTAEEKVRPLDPDEVIAWIREAHGTILATTGIRIFADYVPQSDLEDPQKYTQLQQAESIARRHESYWKLGQLIHVMFQG